MPPAGRSDDENRRRELERIVFAKGDAAEIERAARELEALRAAIRGAQGPVDTVAEPGPTPAGSDAPRSGVAAVRVGSEAPEPLLDESPPASGNSRTRIAVAAALVVTLAGGVLLGSFVPRSPAEAGGANIGNDSAASDPLPSPSPGAGTAFIDINTGQVVGYGGVEPAAALEIFDREQTDADMPAFPLAADLQPSTTRLLEMAGNAAIFAAMDTLARPCLVVVGENQYSATCQTDFEFPKAGIRLSWAPSVAQSTTLSESGRRSPVVYTVVWLPNGMVEVGALVQGR